MTRLPMTSLNVQFFRAVRMAVVIASADWVTAQSAQDPYATL
jgi:hypothetical protein